MIGLGRTPVPLIVLAALLACSDGSGPPAIDRTAVVGFNAAMQSFNPLVTTDQNSIEVNYYMLFTPLIQYDSLFEPRPHLAASWDLEPEGVTFHLNRDVRWHDGQPVTAHDVLFTFQRAKDPQTASILSSAYLALVESAEVVDSFTIRFEFVRPHARPLDGFWWPPVPRHLLSEVPPDEMLHADFNRYPIGSGPFRFVAWESGEGVRLERNPDFSQALGGPAKLERVVFRFIGESATLLSEALTGGIDVDGSVYPHQAADIEAASGVRLMRFASREYYYIGWNTQNPLLSDARVRRALTMAIDRRQLIDALLFGYAQPAVGTIAPWHPMFANLEPLPYDPEGAARLFAEAGWRDRDGDGIREDSNGRPLQFVLMTNHENPVRTDIAQVVQSQLTQVGVQADVKLLEWQTLLSRHRGREFEGVVQSWVLDNFRVDPAALFHSSQADRSGSYNRSSLRDETVDRWIEEASITMDTDEGRRLWGEFSLALQQAQPFTFLMWLDELASVSDRLQGVRMDARGTLVSVADWQIAAQ